jgi:hypothetical protein
MSRTKTPYIDVESILNLIGDFAGDTKEWNYCRYIFALRFPLNPDNGRFKAHIRVETYEFAREHYDEPWVIVPDKRVVEILETAEKDENGNIINVMLTKRLIELTWGALHESSWVPIRDHPSRAYDSMQTLGLVLRQRPYPSQNHTLREAPTLFFKLTDEERHSLQKVIGDIENRYNGKVKNYKLKSHCFSRGFA